MTPSWAERERDDAGLHAFVSARIAQAVVELAALKVEAEHRASVIAHQDQQITALRKDKADLEKRLERKK